MNKKLSKILVFLMLSCFLGNSAVFANQKKHKVLRSGIVKNAIERNIQRDVEVVEFIPEDGVTEINLSDINDLLNSDKMKVIKLSDLNDSNDPDTKSRLKKAAAFMMLGGLSVSGNVQKSISERKADNRLANNLNLPKSLKDGWRADDNMFIINYVGHPLEWFLLANYLKASGASNKEALLISQATSLTWEFVMEGNYVSPSPKDLASNALGSLAGIYLYNTVLNKPMNAAYIRLSSIGEKHGIDLQPQVRYNSQTRGMIVGALVKIKK